MRLAGRIPGSVGYASFLPTPVNDVDGTILIEAIFTPVALMKNMFQAFL